MKKLFSLLAVMALIAISSHSLNSQTYLTQDFESAFVGTPPAPTGWSQSVLYAVNVAAGVTPSGTDGSKTWTGNTWNGSAWTQTSSGSAPTGAASGTGVLYMNDYNWGSTSTPIQQARMESSSFDLTSSTSPYVRFYWFANQGVGLTLNMRVMVSSNGGATWYVLTPVVNGFTVTNLTWNRISILIPAAYRTANCKIAIEMTNRYGTNSAYLDLLTVEEYTPTTITSAASGDWNAGATWVGGVVPTADNNVVIAGTHTVTVTNAASTTGIIGRCQNLTINSGGILAHGLGTANLLHVFGNVSVSGTLNAFNGTSGRTLYVGGNFTINTGGTATFNTSTTQQGSSGALALSTGASTLVWLGNQAATFTNSGTLTGGRINNVYHMNQGGVTYNSPVGVPFTVGLFLGAVNPNGNLTLGNAAAAATAQIIVLANGSFTSNPIWNNTNISNRSNHYYSPNWVPLTQTTLSTGNEIEVISAIRTVSGNFTMNTHNNLQLTYPLTLGITGTSGSWTLTRGIVVTDITNQLTTTSFISGTAGTAPSTVTPPSTHGSYVVGYLRRTFAASGTTARVFPLGVGTSFNGTTPNSNVAKSITINPGTAASQSPTVSIEGVPSGTLNSPLTTLFGVRSFRINLNGGADFPATATIILPGMNYTFGNSDNMLGTQDQLRIAQSTAITGAWTERSLTSGTGAFVNNTLYTRTSSATIAPLATYGEYFTLATTAPVMTYTSSTSTQTVTADVGTGAVNAQVIGLEVVMNGSLSPISLTSFDLSTDGSTDPPGDITNAKLWYTGTSPTFATTTQFGSTYNGPNGPFTITGTQTLSNGTNYFWLTYDVQGSATPGNTIDAEFLSVTGGGSMGVQTPLVSDPGSGRLIAGPLSGTYTIGLTAMRELLGKDLKYEPRTRKVKVMVPDESIVEKTPIEEKSIKQPNNTNTTPTSQLMKHKLNMPMKEVEIDETYYELTENGSKYTGPLYASYKNAARNRNNSGNTTDLIGNYTTITAALSDLNNLGVSGPVTFLLIDNGTYPGETYPLQFNNGISGVSATNTVTLKPQTAIVTTIPGNVNANATLRILSSYVTVEGSNSGGTDRSLTIQNNSTTTPSAVLVGSTGTTPITNVVVKNCNITNGANTSSAVVISDASTIGNAGYFNTITVQNNSIEKAYIGIYANGGTAAANGLNLVVANNSLTSSGANSIRLVGLYAQYTDGATFSNNTISNIANTTDVNFLGGIWLASGCRNFTISGNNINTISSTASTSSYVNFGIFLSTGVSNGNYDINGNTISNITTSNSATTTGIVATGAVSGINIQRNKISNIKNTNSTGWGANGIYLGSSSTTGDIKAQNNMIFDIAAYGYISGTSVTDNGYGIIITAGTNHKIYNNSVLMNTNQNVDGLPAALNITSGVTTVSGTDVRNNVLISTQSVGTNRYAIYSGAASNVYSSINFNCYRSSGPNVGFIGSTNRATISDWRTGTGKDNQSFSSLPLFVSSTDLHIQTSDLTLNGRGTYIAGVNSDYDGDSRPTAQSTSVGPVDVGCDQYTEGSYNPNICAISGDDYYDGGLIAVEVVSGTISVTQVRQYPGVRTPNNTLLKDGSREFEIKNPVKNSQGTEPTKINKTKRDGTSGGQTDAMAVNVPWIYWELTDLTSPGASVRFYFNEEMLATIVEADLKLSFWDGSAWDNGIDQTVNTSGNYIELSLPGGFVWGSTALFAMADGNAPLPVVLSSFDAAVMKRDVSLSWTTESEINNQGFSVERRIKSQDNRYSDWKEVAFVEGKGNTTTRQSYSYSDKKLNSGTYQYRLKQVDFNGNYEYHSPSNNADLVIGKPGVFDISQNYPNPSNPTSNIDFQMPFDGKVSLRVYDILGKEVATLVDGYRTADFYTAKFDGTNLSTGIYFYRIIAESGTERFTKTLKMILVK